MAVNEKHEKRNLDQTRDRLLSSGLNLLAKNGYRGAVTREIAIGAGVTEMTLFRHFRTKDELFAAAVIQTGEQLLSLIAEPSGNIVADLQLLSANLAKQIASSFVQLIRILPELEEHRELKELIDSIRDKFNTKFLSLIHYYQSPTTPLCCDDAMIIYMFVGPVFFYSLDGASGSGTFDSQQHVKLFLSALYHDEE